MADEQQSSIQWLYDAIENPLYDNDSYAVIVVNEFVPQLGAGLYGVVNKSTHVVEATGPQLLEAVAFADELHEKLRDFEIQNFRILN